MEHAARPASLALGAASLLAVVWAVAARSVFAGVIAVGFGSLAIASALLADRIGRQTAKPRPAARPVNAPTPAVAGAGGPAVTPAVVTARPQREASAPAPAEPWSEPPTEETLAAPSVASVKRWSVSTEAQGAALEEVETPAPEEGLDEPSTEPVAAPHAETTERAEASAEEHEAVPLPESPLRPPPALAEGAPVRELEPAVIEVEQAAEREVPVTATAEAAAGELELQWEPVVRSLPTAPDPQPVVDALFVAAGFLCEPSDARLWLEDPDSRTLRLVAAAGERAHDDTPVALTADARGAAVDEGLVKLERIGPIDEETPVTWRLAMPLTTPRLRGVATLDILGPTEPDAGRLTTLLAPLRPSLTAAVALHVARQEALGARALLDTARELGRLLDPDAVIAATLDHAMTLSGAQTGSVLLIGDDDALYIAAARGIPQDVVETTRITEGNGIAGWVLASGQSMVVEDLTGSPRSRRHGIRSSVSVPLADEDGVLGVMNVGSRRFHARLSRPHMESLESLGRIAALALRNARAVRQSTELYLDTLKALALALETKDPYAQGGTERILELVERIGAQLGLDDDELQPLRIAAMLHDIGMNAAGEVVAVGERPLSTVEWGLLKMHPVIAADIIRQAPALRSVVPIVYHHHEHYDGSGYVAGIAGEEIPLGARILSVADSYVAMTSDRPYRPAMSSQLAAEELIAGAGTQFDPRVVEALLKVESIAAASETGDPA